jgi:hypothetical protein
MMTSASLICIALILLIVVHLIMGLVWHDASALMRLGQWFILAGVVFVARPVIRLGYQEWLKRSQIIDGGGAECLVDHEEIKDAVSIQIYAPTLTVIGILLSAYGDLLLNAIKGA